MIATRSRTVVMHDPDTGLTVSSESVIDPRAASRAFDTILDRLQACS
jgi:hypothetical protein